MTTKKKKLPKVMLIVTVLLFVLLVLFALYWRFGFFGSIPKSIQYDFRSTSYKNHSILRCKKGYSTIYVVQHMFQFEGEETIYNVRGGIFYNRHYFTLNTLAIDLNRFDLSEYDCQSIKTRVGVNPLNS